MSNPEYIALIQTALTTYVVVSGIQIFALFALVFGQYYGKGK